MNVPDQRAILNSLTAAISGGMLLTIAARRLRVPGIVLLLFGGIALGPEGVGLVKPESLDGFLTVIVSLAVGLILFEGGLTLDLRGYAAESFAITRLLTVGVVVTWLGTAFAVWGIFHVDAPFALLAGSMVIVTGPTVIGPLLKRIQVISRLHAILHWEGVLIDAIGVFIATLCFEWLAGRSGQAAVTKFIWRALAGSGIGFAGGYAIVLALRRRLVPANLLNVFALGAAVLIFGVTDAVISAAGLLAVTVAGFVVGWKHPSDDLKAIRGFKAEITDLLIGMLFILLASRLKLASFYDFGLRGVALVAFIMLVVRPLNVLASTAGSRLGWREKVFLSWVAPRGIVAASMASLFGIALGSADGRFLETFVYSVIVATVVLQGLSAGWVARLLGVRRPEPAGWLIVNADAFGRRLARFIREEAKLDVLILDSNARLIAEARAEGLPALCEDALNVDLAEEREEFQKIGHLLSLTDNAELNELLCSRWSELFGRDHVYRWSSSKPGVPAAGGRGRIAFPRLARPSVIASEIATEAARFQTAVKPEAEGTPLLAFRDGALFPAVETVEPWKEGEKRLVMERAGGFLARSLEAGGALDLQTGNLTDLYKQLIDFVIQRHPAISKEETLTGILEAGKLIPAWLGHGVAIPHLYNPRIARRACVLARLRDGLHVPEQAEPLRLVFFLVSPAGDPEGHLAAMGEIARFCADAGHRKALLDFSAPEEALRFVQTRSNY